MTDDVENLVLEHLKRIQGEIVGLKDEIRGTRAEVTALRHQVTAAHVLVEQALEDIAGVKVRLDRIERRLDMVEVAK